MVLLIETYNERYRHEIIELILNIQNKEAKINLSLNEQPDLLNITESCCDNGGQFWVALSDDKVVGTIGLMMKDKHCAILKKFFVVEEYRSKKVGLALSKKILEFAKKNKVEHIILDTPSVAKT